ncbi:MAG: hypothetical protein LBL71_00595 [Endomicrobium sp.]|jgi:hypothetical protein|nr:hypothetical protein [Endomicrobium sp.]
MRILREVIAVSLAFLLALSPLQAAGEEAKKKVKIGLVNNKKFSNGSWKSDDDTNLGGYIKFFRREDNKNIIESFVRAAKADCEIMKIIELPDPLPDFTPAGDCNSLLAYDYLDLATGKYTSASFGRSKTINYDTVIFSNGHSCDLWYFEVEASEAAAINDKLTFCPYPETLSLLEPTPVSEDSGQINQAGSGHKRLLTVGVLLAAMGAGGIGLYIRQKRKEEERRKREEEEKNKGLIGRIYRIIKIILRRNSEVIN